MNTAAYWQLLALIRYQCARVRYLEATQWGCGSECSKCNGALALAHGVQGLAAEASAAARKLMGIEP